MPIIYLVGTQHVDGPGVDAVVRTASGLLPGVNLLATEVSAEEPDDFDAIVWNYFASDQPPFLDQQIAPPLWRIISRQGAEAGLPAARLRQLSPSGATILLRNALDETPSDPLGQGVDAQLAALAQA
ncbi:MAG: TraB/GumN family protein, partial [Pseudomonadota bacterium]